ncbi:uncharacterized protein LOC18446842 isoform X2 [Amborella trichopoda]|uniref:uncharacterized protein LOC18446842 isoform X2 n=1 Tax=Amborella trichopoda TaxID=13333 RepID=UPI0009C0BF12|nr:uncharacterized protein LOC18446842 isoform X2 [Amborella trichopoda]|eukprot:XP_020530809.1 uncharacterized protein LOC18446842 isoform X2 [Amborella trichopoda]
MPCIQESQISCCVLGQAHNVWLRRLGSSCVAETLPLYSILKLTCNSSFRCGLCSSIHPFIIHPTKGGTQIQPCIGGGSMHMQISWSWSRVICVPAHISYDCEYQTKTRGCCSSGGGLRCVSRKRMEVLEQVDMELAEGDEEGALMLIRELQDMPDGLRGFGAARQIPQRSYSLDELKLNRIDTSLLLSPVDTTLRTIKRNLQLVTVLGEFSLWTSLGYNQLQLLFFLLGLLSLWSLDLIIFSGGLENMVLDTFGNLLSGKYRSRVVQHEAGHFLVAYLLGVLPKGYTLSSFEALRKEGSLNIQAGTTFVDIEFLEETLNQFSCIAMAGVVAEYILFGFAEGGLSDIEKLDGLLKGLGFTQKKADSLIRWAVLNTVIILRRHQGARSKLAEAMSSGKSVGSCIDTIENAISNTEV